MFEANMRESPNGMASASQADSRGFDSRLSLQKRPQKNSGVFFGAKLIEPQAHACYDLRQWHVLRLSVRARRALRPRGANSRLLHVRVRSAYKITPRIAAGKLSDLYVKSASADCGGAFLIDFFLVMHRSKSDRCNGLHTF